MRESVGPAMAPLKGEDNVSGASSAVAGGEDGGGGVTSTASAVSFGFVATAVLVSMFLFMALFEHLLRPRSGGTEGGAGDGGRRRRRWLSGRRGGDADLEANKLHSPSPEMSVYAKGVSVIMPGQEVPTYIAHPAPCPPEKNPYPSHSNPNPLSPPSSSHSNPSS